jgi:hypothetical protein
MDVRNRRGQKGSALVVITLLVLLSSVLGLALLSTTLTSHQSVLNSENNTKAKYLAEYGVTIGLEDLQKKLDEFNKGNISDWDWMLSKIDELRNFRGNGIPDSMQMKERYEYSLKLNDQPDVNNRALGQYVISGYLEATGEANGKKVKFRAPVQISNIADVFNFALTAKNNIYLNGGVEIHGSLYAGEKLVVHKIAHFKHGSQYNFTSVYPEIHGKISAGPLNANIHHIYHIGTHGHDSDQVGKHKITGNPVPIDQLSEQGYLVGNYKVAKVPAITFPELNMNQIKEEIKQAAGFSESQLRNSGKTFYHQNRSGVDYYYITGADRNCFLIFCGRWYEKSTTYRIGQNNGNKGPFKGVYYINGDLEIRGDVRLEGTFYVNGNVSMQYTKRTENPIAAAIIAQGEIEIANNNLYNDQPAILNAFFWSLADDFVIYGVGSNLKINGGVIAKNIVLNGVRGKTYEGSKLTFNPDPQRYEQNGKKVPSRLTIVYDEQFITHPPAGVPTNEGFKLSQIGQWEYVEE